MSLYPHHGFDGTFPARRHVHAWFLFGILLAFLVAVLVSLTMLVIDSASPETNVLLGVFDVSVFAALVRRLVLWRRTAGATSPRSRELRCIATVPDDRRNRWLAAHDRARDPQSSRGGGAGGRNSFPAKFHTGI